MWRPSPPGKVLPSSVPSYNHSFSLLGGSRPPHPPARSYPPAFLATTIPFLCWGAPAPHTPRQGPTHQRSLLQPFLFLYQLVLTLKVDFRQSGRFPIIPRFGSPRPKRLTNMVFIIRLYRIDSYKSFSTNFNVLKVYLRQSGRFPIIPRFGSPRPKRLKILVILSSGYIGLIVLSRFQLVLTF